MSKPRVVLDTNVVVSAAIRPGGLDEEVVELVAAHAIALYASEAVHTEYEVVLARPKFRSIHPDRLRRFLALLKTEAILVAPDNRVTESADESDNRLLECAEAAQADYLITGNKRHFPERWKSTRIVNAREYLRGGSTPTWE